MAGIVGATRGSWLEVVKSAKKRSKSVKTVIFGSNPYPGTGFLPKWPKPAKSGQKWPKVVKMAKKGPKVVNNLKMATFGKMPLTPVLGKGKMSKLPFLAK